MGLNGVKQDEVQGNQEINKLGIFVTMIKKKVQIIKIGYGLYSFNKIS